MGVSIELGDIQETLLIPLYGRAQDAHQAGSVLHDTSAADMVQQIDYDFARFSGPSLAGSVLRASMFDGWVRAFLAEHPDGTVVDLGCGLSTRFRRVDNGRVRWFDLDVPDTMALRRQFCTDGERYTMLDGSIHATDWYPLVRERGGPVFLLSEAVLLYFPDTEVRSTLRRLAAAFPATPLAIDTGGRAMMASQNRNPVFRALPARMTWSCDDPSTLADCGLTLVESRTFAQPQPEVAASWPVRYRWGMRVLRVVLPPMVTTYKINLFRTADPGGGD